ncbi:MAG: cytidine deaminase, partial [Alphaproteobacteria bacterium]|nr:cytidine deaminase [Alphaproteobacteria bacterium]
AMIAAGHRKIAEILIVADTESIVPCGNCLQKIAEFADDKTLIHSADLKGVVRTFKLGELLCVNFKAEDMKNA